MLKLKNNEYTIVQSEVRPFLDALWRHAAGKGNKELECITPERNILNIRLRAFRFIEGMVYRLFMGAFRYGLINAPNKPIYDRLSDIERRVNEYRETGNDELLMDIANMALMEFCEGMHPKKHFSSKDDGNHTKEM